MDIITKEGAIIITTITTMVIVGTQDITTMAIEDTRDITTMGMAIRDIIMGIIITAILRVITMDGIRMSRRQLSVIAGVGVWSGDDIL